MKKILIFLMAILFVSCDPLAYYDYFITNNCTENIVVIYKTKNNPKATFQISPNITQLIHSDEAILPLRDRTIEYFLEEIIVVKGNDASKVNYVNKNLWDFRITSKNNAECYLTVIDNDFEVQ